MTNIEQALANINTSNIIADHVSKVTNKGYVLQGIAAEGHYMSFNGVQHDVAMALRLAGHKMDSFLPAAAYTGTDGILRLSVSISVK